MTQMICVRCVIREANAGFQAVVAISNTTPIFTGGSGGVSPPAVAPRRGRRPQWAAALTVASFLRVSILDQNAWAADGAQIIHLSYIGVTLIRKQLLRTHVLGRENEGRDTSLSDPS